MKMTSKALIVLLAASSQIHYTVLPTAQEILSKIRVERPTTLQALKDIENNIKDEIKAVEKKIKNQDHKVSNVVKKELEELKKAQLDIQKQIKESSTTPVIQEKKDNIVASIKQKLPSQEKINTKAQEVKENVQEKATEVKKGSKKIWNKVVNGVKNGSHKIAGLFQGVGNRFTSKRTLAAAYKVNEYQSNDGKKYYLVMTMPNFTKEQTSVAINEASNGHYILNITAETNKSQSDSNIFQAKSKTGLGKDFLRQSVTSTFVTSTDRNLHFHDGKIEISIDLPANIKPHSYDMVFEDHML